jgi:hypothetical protein
MSCDSGVRRIDDDLYSYRPEGAVGAKEIRIQVPVSAGPDRGMVAAGAAQALALKDRVSKGGSLDAKVQFTTILDDGREQTWIVERNRKGLLGRILYAFQQVFPMLRIPGAPGILDLRIKKVSERALPWVAPNPNAPLYVRPFPNINDSSWLEEHGFKDPFTSIATDCLQRNETHFVAYKEPRGDYRFVLGEDGHLLGLVPIRPGEKEDKDSNKKVLQKYISFLKATYGDYIIERCRRYYNVDFNAMEKEGRPLLPDHVFRANVVANDIWVQDVQETYGKLVAVGQKLATYRDDEPAQNVLAQICHKGNIGLSLREARKLLVQSYLLREKSTEDPSTVDLSKITPPVTARDLKNFIDSVVSPCDSLLKKVSLAVKNRGSQKLGREVLLAAGLPQYQIQSLLRGLLPRGEDSTADDLVLFLARPMDEKLSRLVRALPASDFQRVVSLLVSDQEELERSFTGRKIPHLAICGYPTMGSSTEDDPCRNLFELLHIMKEDLKKPDTFNFYELLSHVAVKKAMYRRFETAKDDGGKEEQVSLGFLLPGPQGSWYSVDYFQDDSTGNVNYVLNPVGESPSGDLPPMIKLYRSTNSSPNAVGWKDSLKADLNPDSPGTLEARASKPYEEEDFRKRTIPVWVAYLVAAKGAQEANPEQSRVFLEKACDEFKTYVKENKPGVEVQGEDVLVVLQGKRDQDPIPFLEQRARDWNEHPEQKIDQDIVFAGHSLGGALAQKGMWDMLWAQGRTVLPGRTAECFSFDAPAINYAEAEAFIRFGEKHKGLLDALEIKTSVRHSFARGDIVPKAGSSHLGTLGPRDDDLHWLKFEAKVFKPLPGATALGITTNSAHGQRIGRATVGEDYDQTSLSRTELRTFDHAFWLNGFLSKTFGYKVFRSPRFTEGLRIIAGRFVRFMARRCMPIVKILFSKDSILILDNISHGQRDPNRVWVVGINGEVTVPVWKEEERRVVKKQVGATERVWWWTWRRENPRLEGPR